MQPNKRLTVVALACVCALAGAAVGITQSSASSGSARRGHAAGVWPAGRHGGPPVHAVEVVPNRAGNAFITVTTDHGTITAVDADAGTITLKEGTSSLTYATPTITVPSGATVLLDGKSSSLADLAAGDHVSISSSSEGTTVFAIDSSFKPPAGHHIGGPPPGAPGF
jgi:hypothetical protein